MRAALPLRRATTHPAGSISLLTPEMIEQIQTRPNASIQYDAATGRVTIGGTAQAGYRDTRVHQATSMFEGAGGGGGSEGAPDQTMARARAIAEALQGRNPSMQVTYTQSDGTVVTRGGAPAPAPARLPQRPVSMPEATIPAPTAAQVEQRATAAIAASEQESCTATLPPSFESIEARNSFVVNNPACRAEALALPIRETAPVWPWIVGGLVVAGALAGGGYYWYSLRSEGL